MKRVIQIQSSFLRSASWIQNQETESVDEYDSKGNIIGWLEIKLKSGKNYAYQNVPHFLWQGFVDCNSKGNFFGIHIRGSFPFIEVIA